MEALEVAALIGINILDFWDLTPFEFGLYVKAYNRHKKDDQDEKLTLAYLSAYWQRVKKMPSLKQILGKEQPKKQMAAEDILREVKKMNESLGGTIY